MRLRGLFIIGLMFLVIAIIGLGILIRSRERNHVRANLQEFDKLLFNSQGIDFAVLPDGGWYYSSGTGFIQLANSSPDCITFSLIATVETATPDVLTPSGVTDACGSYSVEVEWPAKIEVGNSEIIRVTLLRAIGADRAIAEIPGNMAIMATPMANPFKILQQLPPGILEPEVIYRPFAVTSLNGVNFDIASASPASQSFDQQRLDWVWSVTPKKAGTQWIDINVEVNWNASNNSDRRLGFQYWRDSLSIETFQPIITSGQISLMSLVSGLLGSALSIPWFIEKINQRRKSSRKKSSGTARKIKS